MRGRLFDAAAWMTLAYLTSQVFRLVGNLIMTRLLAPEMFGIMSIVLVIQLTLTMLCDFGLRVVVIQSRRGDDPAFLNTVWTLEVLRGLLIWILGLAAATGLLGAAWAGLLPQGAAWGAPELPAVIAISITATLITGLQSTKLITAQRHLEQRSIATIELIALLIGLVGMIAIGFATRSIWALVAGSLISALATTLMSHWWLPGLRNRLAWDRAAISEIYSAGRWVLLSSLLLVLSANADRMLLASFIGAAELGLYSIAVNLILLIESVGSKLFSTVILASLSATAREDISALRNSLSRQRVAIDVGSLAASGMLFVLGPSIVNVLYDDRYSAAGPMLQILALTLIFTRYNIFPAAYLAIGRPELTATVNTIKLISLLATLPLFYYLFQTTGAIFAVAFHGLASTIAILAINQRLALNDFRLELAVLPAWLAGWWLGHAGLKFFALIAGWRGFA